MFRSSTPHFFKIILNEVLRDKKLSIPKKFSDQYGADLPNKVILKTPCGTKWPVEIVKRGDEHFIENGLSHFVDFYSLAYGTFLLFEYDKKNFCFSVVILDKSATEIDYPVSIVNEKTNVSNSEKVHEEKDQEGQQDDACDQISVDVSGSRRKGVKSASPVFQPRKRVQRENSKRKAEGEPNLEVKNENRAKSGRKKKLNKEVPMKLTSVEKCRVLDQATANFKSDYPWFMLAMAASYVAPLHDWAIIPAKFVKQYLPEDRKNTAAILQVSDGKEMAVTLSTRTVANGRIATRISYGWKQFSQANQLNVGDVCVFELIDRAKIIFKVTFFRN